MMKEKAMTQPTDQPAASTPITDLALSDSAVANYLRDHPDFLIRNPDVLDALAPPTRWSGDGVVDMQQYLINRNRSEMDELRDCAQDVIETSRFNMSTQTRAHAAVLALMATRQWGDMVHVVSHDWPLLLDVDVVSLAFEPPARPDTRLVKGDLGQLASGAVDCLLGDDQDVRLFRELNDDGSLFGSGAGLVCSAALVRMRPLDDLPAGLLALGARGASFHPGQGTELLTFLCRVLEQSMVRALNEDSALQVEFGD